LHSKEIAALVAKKEEEEEELEAELLPSPKCLQFSNPLTH